jgi:hypothetical protein
VNESDEPVFERLRQILEKEQRTMSEVIAELVRNHVEAKDAAGPQAIELEGEGQKRVFQGRTLYWDNDRDSETGVFLTAKGAIAFWMYIPAEVNGNCETFKVYDSLEEFFDDNDWLDKRHNRHIKDAVQREYKALTGEKLVEHLDI